MNEMKETNKKYMAELAAELKAYNYDNLYAAAKEYFGDNVDFGKTVIVDGKELNYHKLLELVVAGAPVTPETYMDITLWMSTYVSKCMNDVIDAAKTGYRVIVLFLDKFQKVYRSGAVLSKDYAEISMVPGQLDLNPIKLSIRGAKDEMKYEERKWISGRAIRKEKHKSEEGTYYTYVVEDFLTSLRNEIALEAYEMLQGEIKKSVIPELSGYQTQSIALSNDLKYLSSMYTNYMRMRGADKKTAKKHIVNFARTLCKVSGINPDNYFKEIYRVSSAKANDGKVSMNGFYLAFTPEAIRFYVETYCPDAKFQNKVYRFGNASGKLGQRIKFVNGVSEDGFYTESKVNGTYTLTIDSNCEAVIERSAKEMIPPVIHDATAIAFELTTGPEKKTEEIMKRIEKARLSKAKFTIRYVNDKEEITDNFRNSHLWLVANDKPICSLYNRREKNLFEKYVAGQAVEIEQVDLSVRKGGRENREYMVMIIGHVIPGAGVQRTATSVICEENTASKEEFVSENIASSAYRMSEDSRKNILTLLA